MLQTYIYQLRKLLSLPDYGHAGALYTWSNGYLLSLPTQALDCSRFQALAARGADHLRQGELAAAADALRAALAEWRGRALSDVEGGAPLRAAVSHLERVRETVLEQRLDVDLVLGRHRLLVDELTALAAGHRLHEGMHLRLMLALYGAGLRCEALRVFRRITEALADELGLEPGPELTRVHRSIMDHAEVRCPIAIPPAGASAAWRRAHEREPDASIGSLSPSAGGYTSRTR